MKRFLPVGLLVSILGLGLLYFVALFGPSQREMTFPLGTIVSLSDGQLFLPEILDGTVAGRICPRTAAGSTPTPSVAGIGPHHLPFAAPVLWTLYSSLASMNPDVTRIVILGPDHSDAGDGPITSAAVDYTSSLGLVRGDIEFVEKLADTGAVTLDSSPLNIEHAIYTHIPFIQRFFPTATVVPVLFRSDAASDEGAALGRLLAEVTGPETLVILSSDLSHYRSHSQADLEDALTIDILSTVDDGRLMDAQFDARPAARTLFAYLEARSVGSGTVLCRSNSADMGGDAGYTTGYAGIVY